MVEPTELLLAVHEISNLKAQRDRALDTKDWSTYRKLHAPEYVSENEDYGRSSLDEVIDSMRIHLENAHTAHHSHTPEILLTSATSASGVWGMEDMLFWNDEKERRWLHGFGFYFETYEKRDGEWVFTSRRLERTLVRRSGDGAQPGLSFRSGE